MVHIKVTKGLDIPIKGKPEGQIKQIVPAGEAQPLATPKLIALDLSEFEGVKFRLLVKAGDVVKIGQPLVEDKDVEGRMFASPAAGVVKDIRRGLKRRLLDIVIEVQEREEHFAFDPIHVESASALEIAERLKAGGCFTRILSRPFSVLADPTKRPRSIFVKAIESAPFMPPAEMQIYKKEREFQAGLTALSKLTDGAVNLVYRQGTTMEAFTKAANVALHTAEGPHPVANYSLHIQQIDPITSVEDLVWTVNAHDVAQIGTLLLHGRYDVERVISIAGPAVLPEKVGYFKAREGYPVEALISGRVSRGPLRFVSGDPLMGHSVSPEDFLGFNDYVFCVLAENTHREFLHFFRLGTHKFTFSRAYLTGHLDSEDREYDFNTNQHGERRAFIVGSDYYDKVQPLDIPTVQLVKAIMAHDYDLAAEYGLLEVDKEDFALTQFIDPSKIEMVDIVKRGLKDYAAEMSS